MCVCDYEDNEDKMVDEVKVWEAGYILREIAKRLQYDKFTSYIHIYI